jgi:hypothetical protein
MSRNSHSPEAFAIFIQELETAMEHIRGQYDRNRKMTSRIHNQLEEDQSVDEFEWSALGYTIHNIYNAIENYFLRVSKFFENSLPENGWHKNLIDRMSFSIENVRPALLTKHSRQIFHELRSFRHVFRNLYDTQLDGRRVDLVNQTIPEAVEIIIESHRTFTGKLDQIRSGLQ